MIDRTFALSEGSRSRAEDGLSELQIVMLPRRAGMR